MARNKAKNNSDEAEGDIEKVETNLLFKSERDEKSQAALSKMAELEAKNAKLAEELSQAKNKMREDKKTISHLKNEITQLTEELASFRGKKKKK